MSNFGWFWQVSGGFQCFRVVCCFSSYLESKAFSQPFLIPLMGEADQCLYSTNYIIRNPKTLMCLSPLILSTNTIVQITKKLLSFLVNSGKKKILILNKSPAFLVVIRGGTVRDPLLFFVDYYNRAITMHPMQCYLGLLSGMLLIKTYFKKNMLSTANWENS